MIVALLRAARTHGGKVSSKKLSLQNMAEVAIEGRVYRYEAKPQPTANAPGKIVEAFGLGKCPKLAEQVRPGV